MSVARLSSKHHPLYQIFLLVDPLCSVSKKRRRGRPQRFSDAIIMKCMVDQVYHRIHRFRGLEWKLKQDFWALRSMGISKVPDHTTFCRRIKQIEESLYARIYKEIFDELEPQSEVCYWDSTPLRSSRYDKEADKGKGTRLGWFHGYQFHAIVSGD